MSRNLQKMATFRDKYFCNMNSCVNLQKNNEKDGGELRQK